MSEIPDTPENERDDATFSMFGDAEMGSSGDGGYQVLARKYRPRVFEDLIGQEAMVRTLSNAFETGRIAHAFMLTGVRGVGKTTTARLLARGLNYESDSTDQPSIHLDPPGAHCEAIMESRHPDVMELDAASRTGVADMRDLLDGVRYSPVTARYKVYIIDEVHMLSTAAFNALLKTLEEPPGHVKFIFATTEIRKVPITVLSRCQRFDLKRLAPDALAQHLGRVAGKENAKIDEEGLALIARAAEGSVRDGLSILDQAIVQSVDGGAVTGAAVRDMLGLADRGRLLDLFEMALKGDGKGAAEEVISQLHDGADPLIILKDLLDISADLSTAKAMGDGFNPGGPADWTARTKALADTVSPAQASRYWQILLSGYRDTQTAPDMGVAARMVVLRLSAAASLPSPEDAARMIAAGGGAAAPAGKPDAAPGAAPQTEPVPERFEDIVALMRRHTEAILAGETETYVRPEVCKAGTLVCDLAEGAPADLVRRIGDFLEEATGYHWSVTKSSDTVDEETLKERRARIKQEKIDQAREHPKVKQALSLFPGAEIIEVDDRDAGGQSTSSDNIIPMKKNGSS